jgi:nucleoside-diphosphate-sugar epimerase
MERPKLLITGASGVIGAILTKELADLFEIYGIDQTIAPNAERSFAVDIADYRQIEQALQQIGPVEYMVHLAGDGRVKAPWESVLQNNIIGTRNVYEAARQWSIRRVVFASSSHVTGAYEGIVDEERRLHREHEPIRITTQDPIRPDSNYGVSKAFGEALARFYCARFGIESICLRIGMVVRDDDPTRHLRHRKIWLSHRDLVQLVRKSLLSNVVFGIYYGVSDNKGRFWDIANAQQELGYVPLDDASKR